MERPLHASEIALTDAKTNEIERRMRYLDSSEQRAIEKHKLEMDALAIAVEKGGYVRDVDRIVRDRNQREQDMINACDWNHQVYNFADVVDHESVHLCMGVLNQWMRHWKSKPDDNERHSIEVVFDSPGGEVFAGLHLFDFIRMMSKDVDITTVALGNAASMAGVVVQSGTKRVIAQESYMLLHRLSDQRGHDIASRDDYEDRLERIKKIEGRLVNIYANRAAKALTERDPTLDFASVASGTRDLIQSKWTKNDWYVDSDEAYALGFADEIR